MSSLLRSQSVAHFQEETNDIKDQFSKPISEEDEISEEEVDFNFIHKKPSWFCRRSLHPVDEICTITEYFRNIPAFIRERLFKQIDKGAAEFQGVYGEIPASKYKISPTMLEKIAIETNVLLIMIGPEEEVDRPKEVYKIWAGLSSINLYAALQKVQEQMDYLENNYQKTTWAKPGTQKIIRDVNTDLILK